MEVSIKRSRLFGFVVLLASLLEINIAAQQPVPTSPAVDFQRIVRPILSNNCFHCHGPDQATRMAELRLDTREGAFARRENGTPIVPGNSLASLVYQRISEENAARRMPPEFSHKKLTAEQKGILKQWIEQGAPWKEHWAFVAPTRSAIPAVRNTDWVRNPIDYFILSKLEAVGLQPATEADRRTLIRRLSLDLTGLPPTPSEIQAFVEDKSKDAYERLVDHFMDSPHWGENRARYWLDAARYADTHGLHQDNYREMWPYRDWVIQAFNRDLPFDRFTIEQLAGDLLPHRTLDQQIASGFHRCNVTTNEGGVIIDEVEATYAKDRVDTTSTVWLGLTVGCATCHDHKFDPISQKDFYSMAAFFRNTTQHAKDGNAPDTLPIATVPNERDRVRWNRLNQQEADVRMQMQKARNKQGKPFENWLRWKISSRLKTPLDQVSELLELSPGEPVQIRNKDQAMSLALPKGVVLGPAAIPETKALHFGPEGQLELPTQDYFASDKPFSVATWIYQPKKGEDSFTVASQSDPQDENRGWTIDILSGTPSFRITGHEGKGLRISAGFTGQLMPETWNHLAVTYDGSREKGGLSLYVNGKGVTTQTGDEIGRRLDGEIRTCAPLRLGSDGKRYFQGGAMADFHIFSRVISEEEAYLISLWPKLNSALNKNPDQLTAEEREGLHLRFLNSDSGYLKLGKKLKGFAAERREIRKRGAVTHVMQERTDSKPIAHILYRGQYDQPRDKVEANVPAALPPMPRSYPRNRFGLAQWLVNPANPLTARVTINRFWQEVFGTGIVKTSEDFGSQGQAPSHLELLDWLAVEFRESGWDIKKFFRLMVTSATYRQSAVTAKDKLKADPENRLLSRGPQFRLDGEVIRDYALAASGLLVPTIGGPSVKPYQPDGIWEAVATFDSNTRFYKRESGSNLYRRSLYTFWKRSAPPASMEIFGAPSRESCTVRRERTNTPLQALVTMNDPQFVEAARQLAQRALRAGRRDFDRELDFMTLHFWLAHLSRMSERLPDVLTRIT